MSLDVKSMVLENGLNHILIFGYFCFGRVGVVLITDGVRKPFRLAGILVLGRGNKSFVSSNSVPKQVDVEGDLLGHIGLCPAFLLILKRCK